MIKLNLLQIHLTQIRMIKLNLLQIHWTPGDEGQGAVQPEVSQPQLPSHKKASIFSLQSRDDHYFIYDSQHEIQKK